MEQERNEKEELGPILKRLRTDLNITLSQLGQSIGLSHNFLSEVERGKKIPSNEVIRTLANFYKINEDILFEASNKVPLRTLELIQSDPLLQKLLSSAQQKAVENPEVAMIIKEKIRKIYYECLN